MKKYILLSTICFIAIVSVILIFLEKDIQPIIIIGGMTLFLIAALWDPPPKHKDFSYKDLEKATFRALGGGGPIEVPEPTECEEEDNENFILNKEGSRKHID